MLKGPLPDDPLGTGRCFNPYKPGAYLKIGGARHDSGFVECGDYTTGDPSRANGEYTFRSIRLSSPGRLLRFTAVAGVDEASSSAQEGSSVRWTVFYNGSPVCSAGATWFGSPSSTVPLDCKLPDTPRILTRSSSRAIRRSRAVATARQ